MDTGRNWFLAAISLNLSSNQSWGENAGGPQKPTVVLWREHQLKSWLCHLGKLLAPLFLLIN